MPVLPFRKTKTSRVVLIISACSVLLLLGYSNFPLPWTVAGRYVNVNYRNSFGFPNEPDVLDLMADGTFTSQIGGTGTFKVWLTPFGTNIELKYDGLYGALQTQVRRSLDGSTRIILSEDLEHAYVKP